MKRTLVAGALALLVGLGGWLWYRDQPAPQINRTVDQLFEQVSHQKISLRKPSDTREALAGIFSERVTLSGVPILHDTTLSRDEILEAVNTLHQVTSTVEFTEHSRSHRIEGKRAQVYCTTTVASARGPNSRTEQKWELTFDLVQEDRWRISGIMASPAANR